MSLDIQKFCFYYAVKFPDFLLYSKGNARVLVERIVSQVPGYIHGRMEEKKHAQEWDIHFLQKLTAVVISQSSRWADCSVGQIIS